MGGEDTVDLLGSRKRAERMEQERVRARRACITGLAAQTVHLVDDEMNAVLPSLRRSVSRWAIENGIVQAVTGYLTGVIDLLHWRESQAAGLEFDEKVVDVALVIVVARYLDWLEGLKGAVDEAVATHGASERAIAWLGALQAFDAFMVLRKMGRRDAIASLDTGAPAQELRRFLLGR